MRVHLLTIAIQAEHDLVLVRQRARQLAERLGLESNRRTRLATAVSEVSRNAFQYAGGGKVEMLVDLSTTRLLIRIKDSGPGIVDLDAVLSDQYQSKTGLGLGLKGARRLVDGFELDSEPGEGTRVTLEMELPASSIDEQELIKHVEALTRTPPGNPFSEVLQQNQELLKAQEQLAEANRELEHAQDAKDRFLAMLGHELRNLLNALRSSMEVLKRRPKESSRLRMEEIADLQVDHLGRLVNDLLDVSRIVRGTLELRPVAVDAAEELRRTLGAWEERFSSSGRRLTWDVPAGHAWVTADPTRLAQIIGNLLSNADKFTDPGGTVHLVLQVAGDWVRIEVRDDGCGMESHQLEKVFEAFSQTDMAKERMTGGLGLGLAITRALAQAHGGNLSADSLGPGKGTTFTLELPKSRTPAQVVPLQPDQPQSLPGRKILLVDDHRPSILGLSELLSLDGHEVTVAADGPEALEIAAKDEPEVVVCDLGLPGMTGFEVAQELSSGPCKSRLIALTGSVDRESVHRALESGFETVLPKPVDIDQLTRLLCESEESTENPTSLL